MFSEKIRCIFSRNTFQFFKLGKRKSQYVASNKHIFWGFPWESKFNEFSDTFLRRSFPLTLTCCCFAQVELSVLPKHFSKLLFSSKNLTKMTSDLRSFSHCFEKLKFTKFYDTFEGQTTTHADLLLKHFSVRIQIFRNFRRFSQTIDCLSRWPVAVPLKLNILSCKNIFKIFCLVRTTWT